MRGILRDFRHAHRSLRRTPLFTFVAVASLTLAVGANTAVFSLLNALVWRDVQVREPATLVQLSTFDAAGQEAGLSWPVLRELRRREDVFSATLGWQSNSVVDAETHAGTGPVGLAGVSGDFFQELGAVPALGRLISNNDADIEHDVANPVAVIGWNYWQRVYGGASSALGQELRVEGVPLMIISVAPRGFKGFNLLIEPDVTMPLPLLPRVVGGEVPMKQGASRWISVTGRLRPGMTLAGAQARLAAAWPSLLELSMPPTFAGAQRDAFRRLRLSVTSGSRGVERQLRRYTQPLFVVLGLAAVIAAITAVNLCGLAYARAGARAHDVRVRLALGAGAGRVFREAAVEGAVLGVAAAAGSLWAASYVSTAASRLILEDALIPTHFDVTPDARVGIVALGISVSIGVLMSILPMWTLARGRVEATVRASGRTVARSGRVGRLLLTAQVALSIVLLVTSVLLVRSLRQIASTETGLAAGVLVGYPSPSSGAYRGVDPESYYRQTLERLLGIPGIEAAAFTQFKPAGGALPPEAVGRARTPADAGGDVAATATQVSPGFFDVFGIRVLRGREFTWEDNPRGRRVAIVSQSLAARLFGPGGGIGERVRVSVRPDAQDLEVIGIVADARVYDVRRSNVFTVYTPSLQYGENANWKALVLRGPDSTLPAVREVLASIGVESLPRVESLEYITSRTVLSERMLAILAAYFGGLAVVLAAIGIHGQMAYTVSLQRKEIGVRIALGATSPRIISWIVGSGLGIGLIGVVIGLALAVPAVGVVRSLLVEISPYDPWAFTAAPALLLAAIVLACLAPALRAAMVDPIVELRRE